MKVIVQLIMHVCEKCGTGGFDHVESRCPNPVKCVNCGLNHLSRSNECEMWQKEKEILKIKVTRNITYLEAIKEFKKQPEITYSKIVQSAAIRKPETKTTETDFDEKDFNIKASSKVIIPTKYKQNKQAAKSTATTKSSVSTSQPNTSKTNNEKEKPRARSKSRTGKLNPESKHKLDRRVNEHIPVSAKSLLCGSTKQESMCLAQGHKFHLYVYDYISEYMVPD